METRCDVSSGILTCYYFYLNLIACFVVCRCGKGDNQHDSISETNHIYTYARLDVATGNFATENLISADGSFGSVYRADISPTFQVAVKVMSSDVNSGAHNLEQFQNEVKTLKNCRHPHLLALLGHCVDGPQPCLVYEFKTRGCLRAILSERPEELEWRRRLVMLEEIASALDFLHTVMNPPIIHRDIKTANVLVDSHWNCTLGDFGIARFTPDADIRPSASTRIIGTPGYIDPEYVSSGNLTIID
jgi:serine/threonine protein kinase